MNILKNFLTHSFEDIINLKKRENLRMFEGKATESYIFRNLDRNLEKLNLEGWVLYVPYNLKRVPNDKHIHFLMNEDYLLPAHEKALVNNFLKIDNDKSNFTKAAIILFNGMTNSLTVKVYDKLTKAINTYNSYTEFMSKEYCIDTKDFELVVENELKTPFKNTGFEDSIKFMDVNGDNLDKLNILIFDDFFSYLRDSKGIKFYQTNLDAICLEYKENSTTFAIVEVKNKTKNDQVIINKSELEIYASLSKDIDVYFYILMSYDEIHTKKNLLINNFVYGDAELFYYHVDSTELPLFELDNIGGFDCYKIPLNYLKRCNTLLQDEAVDKTHLRIPFVMDAKKNVDTSKYNFYSKILLVSELRKANIISGIFDIKENSIGSSYYIEVNGKKIAIKYVKNISWRMEVTKREYDAFVANGIDYILIVKLFSDGDGMDAINIIGYLPLSDFVANANEMAAISGCTYNKVYWDFVKKTPTERADLIKKNGLTYIFSIEANDCAKYRGDVKPFYTLRSFTKASIKDFA